jgi:hypothetical protein
LFQIRTGASTSAQGTVVAAENATFENAGNITFTEPSDGDGLVGTGEAEALWAPGTYQICERVPFGYSSSLMTGIYGVDWFTPGLNADDATSTTDNEYVCKSFTVVSSNVPDPVVFSVDNTRPGMARTIGYWKNWTGCDATGNQDPILDDTIRMYADDSNANTWPDIRIGDLYIEDNPGTEVNEACTMAVDILDKRPIGTIGVVGDAPKAASDPAVNAAAQLLAYELNQLMNGFGAGSCSKAAQAAAYTQGFLDYLAYTGQAVQVKKGKSQALIPSQIAANLNYLAGILDDYNNNTIMGCSSGIALPYPNQAPGVPWSSVLNLSRDT